MRTFHLLGLCCVECMSGLEYDLKNKWYQILMTTRLSVGELTEI